MMILMMVVAKLWSGKPKLTLCVTPCSSSYCPRMSPAACCHPPGSAAQDRCPARPIPPTPFQVSAPSTSQFHHLQHFMTNYVLLLCSFNEQLQRHVRVHAMEAVMGCWEIEQSLQSLTGVSPEEGTVCDDDDDDDEDENEDEQADSDASMMGFGPLIPTDSERSLMERVRQELKHELKNGYKEKLVDLREEILRKRRAGKLPGDTTSVLKQWWHSHSKWPYPTEEDKARLVQQTGLQLKQINNWFINQRKRNWHTNTNTNTHTNPSSSQTKRKRRPP